jgi:phenylalanyl-tRNA synthetase beta chain
VTVLKRAAMLIKEIAGGEISSEIVDVYPVPKQKTEVTLKNHYLKKLSGKNYHADAVKKILQSLGFEILKEGLDDIRVAVPSVILILVCCRHCGRNNADRWPGQY